MAQPRIRKTAPRTRKAEPRIRLNVTGYNYHCWRLKLPTDEEVGHALGLSRVTVWRVRTGQTAPGWRFIARVLNLFTDAQFEELFEVYLEDGED